MLRYRDTLILYRAGFTPQEIMEIHHAVTPKGEPQFTDISSPAWRSAISYRNNWTQRIRQEFRRVHGRELDRKLYQRIVNAWYSRGVKRSPWDWLKITYRPRRKTDFIMAAKARARARVGQLTRRLK